MDLLLFKLIITLLVVGFIAFIGGQSKVGAALVFSASVASALLLLYVVWFC